MAYELSLCRICNASKLSSILDLGVLPISGKFGRKGEKETLMPLNLGQCDNCGLVQLLHLLPINELYGEFYGYESGLNSSMTTHLDNLASYLVKSYIDLKGIIPLKVIDIASNDGTLLKKFSEHTKSTELIGVDPLIKYLSNQYPKETIKISDFFGSEGIDYLELSNASIVTSISVFYDLDNPLNFARKVHEILENDGLWFLEQSYIYSMIQAKSFDTICHEHLLYLRLIDFKDIFDKAGFSVIDINFNETNGGSVQLLTQKKETVNHCKNFLELIQDELKDDKVYSIKNFSSEIANHMMKLRELILEFYTNGYRIVALGASTKGNILLNYLKLPTNIIEIVGEVNSKKFGKITPGTHIPIVDEDEILNYKSRKQLILILPWHFKETFISKTKSRLSLGDRILFPLPNIELI